MDLLGYALLTLVLAVFTVFLVAGLFLFFLRPRYWLRTWTAYLFSVRQQWVTPVHRMIVGQGLHWLAAAWNKWRQGFYVLIACILFLLVVLALWKIPELQLKQFSSTEIEKIKLTNEHRRTIAQIIAGFAIIIGLFFTWKRIRATEEQVSIAREEQITERFTRAVDQLGSENIHVRLGGIYALERISRDSPTDYGTVMEVLTAFVRERAPLPPPELEGKELGDQTPQEKLKFATDIQAVLTVLGRRNTEARVLQEMPLDLNSTDLKGADIKNAQLEKAHLLGADLREADLSGANLSGAHLSEAHLSGAHLSEAHLSGAHLSGADLRRAFLIGAHLRGADLSGAHLSEANLSGADLREADLDRADLSGTDLGGAHLSEAHLDWANLFGAFLYGANLSGASLFGAHLCGANLSWANLSRANLNGANLSRAYLSGTYLSGVYLSGANLSGANLSRANLSGANLSEVDLRGADLFEADLRGADLREADLTGVKDLIQAQIDKALYCEGTEPPKLSTEFKPPPARKCDEYGNPIEE